MNSERIFVAAFPWAAQNGGAQQERAQYEYYAQRVQTSSGVSPIQFHVPNTFRVGTLDSVLEASDDLSKIDNNVEGVTFKMLGMLHDVSETTTKEDALEYINTGAGDVPQSPSGSARGSLTPKKRTRKSLGDYLGRWKWNEAVYPTTRPLKQLIKQIQDNVAQGDDVIRTKLSEFSEARTRLANIQKKSNGSWSVRPISNTVKDFYQKKGMDKPVDSEYLTTIFVAVPKHAVKEWWVVYPTLNKYTVPQSSDCIADSEDYTLCSVVVFKKFAMDFKNACRDRRWVVRENDAEDDSPQNVELLKNDVEQKRSILIRLLSATFAECFAAWIHLKAIRVFVESVLRYGMPPQFTSLLFMIDNPKEKVVRKSLEQLASQHIGRKGFMEVDTSETTTAALESGFQYVSLKIASPIR